MKIFLAFTSREQSPPKQQTILEVLLVQVMSSIHSCKAVELHEWSQGGTSNMQFNVLFFVLW